MSTQPEAKRIFLLEDDLQQLKTYVQFLEREGFTVRGAETLDKVGAILGSGETFDLLLLDMNLKHDPRALASNIYGSDVGAQFIKKQAAWPPEVLTMTHFSDNVDAWRRSFAIGALALLEKDKTSLEETIDYTRALLLRRAVGLSNPRCKEAMREALDKGGREHQTVEDFLRQFILPELAACLRSPFILVLEHAGATAEAAQEARPSGSEEFKREVAMLVAKASYNAQINDLKKPLKLDEAVFRLADLPAGESAGQVFFSPDLDELSEEGKFVVGGEGLRALLEDAAFILLQLTPDIRISLLIVKDRNLSEDVEDFPLAKLLTKYSLDPLRMTLTSLVERWRHEHEIKRVQLDELSRFCYYLGSETRRIAFRAESEGFVPAKDTSFRRLALLADELCGAGDFFSDLREGDFPPSQRLVLREVVREAWDSLGRGGDDRPGILSFGDGCQATVVASKEELLFIFSRLLHWLVSLYEEDEDAPPHVSVECSLKGRNVELSLESGGPRLNKFLRDSMFVPMTQRINYNQALEGEGPNLFLAMYLAKTILERRYKGSLADHSDEMTGEMGHRLILSMPVINK